MRLLNRYGVLNMIKLILLKVLFISLLACNLMGCKSSDSTGDDIKAKNIILFIGDGMDAEHRKAARWLTVGESGELAMDEMQYSGFLETKSADNAITDSAASATAMATGVKANNGVVSLDSNLRIIPTILEFAKSKGKSVGLVSTTQITHATPAAFASHISDRGMMNEIALQLLSADVNVLLAGGEDDFVAFVEEGCFPGGLNRSDNRNLINEFIAIGYTHVCDEESLKLVDDKSVSHLLGLFANGGMVHPFTPSLADMTKKAIDILSKNQEGFFLMVEGGQIDWASHGNDAVTAIIDTVDLDKAVSVAKKFREVDSSTLIIVTADHETGGMLVSRKSTGLSSEDGPFKKPDGSVFYINWSTTGHTAVNVPITSEGPQSKLLEGVNDNTFLYDVMIKAFGGI